jgi:hypothetical protein
LVDWLEYAEAYYGRNRSAGRDNYIYFCLSKYNI